MSTGDFKRKLTAILSADVVGYSRLMKHNEETTVHTLNKYKKMIFSCIECHSGRLVDSPGDNLLAEFTSVVDAVLCAVHVQNDLKTNNEKLPTNRKMEFRIGINTGDVIQDGHRIYGDGVNVAARIESLADPGGICISRNAYDQVKGKININYEYTGEYQIKNIDEPVRIYKILMESISDDVFHNVPSAVIHNITNPPVELANIVSKSQEKKLKHPYLTSSVSFSDLMRSLLRKKSVLLVAVLFFLLFLSLLGIQVYRILGGVSQIRSVAVMPFENIAGDANTEYICDVVTKNLIDSLSQVPELVRIPSWIIVSKYKGTKLDLNKIEKDLKVDGLLTGQISRRGDDLIIECLTIDTRNESHILSFGPYPLESGDILIAVQDCAEEITESLQIRLSGKEKNNLEAHKLYQRGKYYWDKRTADDLKKAINCFDRVIAMDPNRFIARAHAGLANAYNLLGIYGGASQADSYQKARKEAELALELDEGLAEAHTALGLVYMHYDHNWHEAQSEFKRAIALDPNYETAHQWYAEYLTAIGRFEDAKDEMRQAQKIDPESLIVQATLGWIFYSAGDSDEAIRQLEMTLRADPDYVAARWFLGYAYALKGRYELSIASLNRAKNLSPGNLRIVADLAHVYAISGQRAEALKILSDLNKGSESGNSISQYSYAVIYAGLEEKEKAFEALNTAIKDRPWELVNLKVDHMLDSLHSDPRFKQLVAYLGILTD